MDIFPANQVQNLKNKLTVTSLDKSIDLILRTEKIDIQITNFLNGLKRNKKLYKLNFTADSQYISDLYSTAVMKFQGEKEVSPLSYGLSIISKNIYLYMKKEIEDSLNYIRNYDNICPIDFSRYINQSKGNISSEILLKGGLNIYGYSFEFNINYFLQTLSELIELPNLMINLSPNYKYASFAELDIAYFNQDVNINNSNMGLLKCNTHLKIYNNKIELEKSNNFELYENSLILGEVKSSFPKRLYKSNEVKGKEDSLETIIDKLFNKLSTYYELYQKIGLFNVFVLKNIQIIFFYDNVQINNINTKTIIDFIQNKNFRFFQKIPVHFFIVYTLPAITNVSIYDLKKQLVLMKEKNKKRDEEINILKEKNQKRDEEIRNLKETNRIILFEMEKLKKTHGVNMIEDYNIAFKDNNEININNKDKKPEIKGIKNNESIENNEINLINNNIFNFLDDFNKIQINDTDKKQEIEGTKINESKETNDINPIENNIFNFIDNVIDQNNKENNEKEKKFNKANENMDYLFDFDFDFHKNKDDF